MKQRGFTVIEVIVVSAFLITASVVLFLQLNQMAIQQLNSQKKIAINAIYYSLEESFHPTNGYYPEFIKEDTLKTMDSALLVDPSGIKLGEASSAYRYEPKGCTDNKCTSYSLRATLTDEADFVKNSRNN